MRYSPRERACLVLLAIAGGVGLNGVFLWALVAHPEWLTAALQNPVSLAFMFEALLMVAALAYLLPRWRVSGVHWGWFTVLSLLGGVAFALPVVLLLSRKAPGDGRR